MISIGQKDRGISMNNKGLTLLEVLITLAILGIVSISFIGLFTQTNIGITYSGNRLNAIMEASSILNKIGSKIDSSDQIYDIENVKEIVDEILEKDYPQYEDKNIKYFIEEQPLDLRQSNGNLITVSIAKIKVLIFYDDNNKKVELSTYVPIEEDKNE